MVSIRNEDLQTEPLTALTITSDPDTLVVTPPGGNTYALDSGFRQTTTTPDLPDFDLPDFYLGIVKYPWSIQQEDTVVQLAQRTTFDITVNHHSQSPADSLID